MDPDLQLDAVALVEAAATGDELGIEVILRAQTGSLWMLVARLALLMQDYASEMNDTGLTGFDWAGAWRDTPSGDPDAARGPDWWCRGIAQLIAGSAERSGVPFRDWVGAG